MRVGLIARAGRVNRRASGLTARRRRATSAGQLPSPASAQNDDGSIRRRRDPRYWQPEEIGYVVRAAVGATKRRVREEG
jgi:hypothetical protein